MAPSRRGQFARSAVSARTQRGRGVKAGAEARARASSPIDLDLRNSRRLALGLAPRGRLLNRSGTRRPRAAGRAVSRFGTADGDRNDESGTRALGREPQR